MSFLDDAVSAAKTVGRTVGKKTEEILIISKKKLDAIELENKLSNYYEALGKLYYLVSSGNDSAIGEDVSEKEELIINIKKILADLKELRSEIETLSKNK